MDKAVALCSYVFDEPGSDSNYPLFRNIWIDYNNHNKKNYNSLHKGMESTNLEYQY